LAAWDTHPDHPADLAVLALTGKRNSGRSASSALALQANPDRHAVMLWLLGCSIPIIILLNVIHVV
jgi:hypothetical protein